MDIDDINNTIKEYVNDVLLSDKNVKDTLIRIKNKLFYLYYYWRRLHDNKNVDEAFAIGQCMLQMMVCKISSIIELSQGVPVVPDNKDLKIVDVMSVASIVRSMYELEFLFHNIFVQQSSKQERDLVLYLWQLHGMNNRQLLKNVPDEYKQLQNTEKQQIVDIKKNFKQILSQLNMSEKVEKLLIEYVDNDKDTNIKGYVFNKDDNGKIIEVKRTNMSDPEFALQIMWNKDLYRFLSFQTHPSYLSVLQFGQMFNDEDDKHFLKTLFVMAINISKKMYVDFIYGVDGAKYIWDKYLRK